MTTTRTATAATRLDRLLLVQAHCTLLALAATATFVVSGRRLGRVPGVWTIPETLLFGAGGIAAVAGLGPWIAPRFRVSVQRVLYVLAALTASVAALAAVWVVSVWALMGIQLVVTAAVLAEVGMQRRALAWLWSTAGLLAATVVLYHAVVGVQPRPE